MSIMALIKELTGIVAVGPGLEAVSMEEVCSGAVNVVACGGDGDPDSDFTCLLVAGDHLSRVAERLLTNGDKFSEVSVCTTVDTDRGDKSLSAALINSVDGINCDLGGVVVVCLCSVNQFSCRQLLLARTQKPTGQENTAYFSRHCLLRVR